MIENSGITVNTGTSVNAKSPFVNPLAEKKSFIRKLRSWFRHAARSLPWRDTQDPYAIWISEVMLQQTTVAAVQPYYRRFLEEFPTVHHLARADEIRVLTLWAGLGYYRRARMLHDAAKIIVTQWRGEFPRDPARLLELPGVGRYTANAVVCFAYDWPVATVETNTARVLSRLFGKKLSGAGVTAWHWQIAKELLPGRACREYNYALMDLGSLICTAKAPRCSDCPLQKWCASYQRELTVAVKDCPRKGQTFVNLEWDIFVFFKDGPAPSILMRRIPDGEWHAGLYGLPYRECSDMCSTVSGSGQLATNVGEFTFYVTHHRIRARVWLLDGSACANRVGLHLRGDRGELEWISVREARALPLATPYRRALEFLEKAVWKL
ncbi:MAG: A/G-specific adenine glycosylase [Candidatus Sumerlaeaceae bacterium]